jgi:hypothetical protein
MFHEPAPSDLTGPVDVWTSEGARPNLVAVTGSGRVRCGTGLRIQPLSMLSYCTLRNRPTRRGPISDLMDRPTAFREPILMNSVGLHNVADEGSPKWRLHDGPVDDGCQTYADNSREVYRVDCVFLAGFSCRQWVAWPDYSRSRSEHLDDGANPNMSLMAERRLTVWDNRCAACPVKLGCYRQGKRPLPCSNGHDWHASGSLALPNYRDCLQPCETG